MNQYWISLVFALLITYFSTAFSVLQRTNVKRGPCAIDAYNKSITVHNLRNYCSKNKLLTIFSNLSAGVFPRNGFAKGYIIGMAQNIWNGKNFNFIGGVFPNEHGTVINSWLGTFQKFTGTIYRSKTPIDGKESFALDYKRDAFVFFAIDYIRTVQSNLYLGIATVRPYTKIPREFFLLETD